MCSEKDCRGRCGVNDEFRTSSSRTPLEVDAAGVKYFRFQVETGMDEIGLEERKKIDEML